MYKPSCSALEFIQRHTPRAAHSGVSIGLIPLARDQSQIDIFALRVTYVSMYNISPEFDYTALFYKQNKYIENSKLHFNTFSLSLLDCLKSSKRSIKKFSKIYFVKDCTFEASNVSKFQSFIQKPHSIENLKF